METAHALEHRYGAFASRPRRFFAEGGAANYPVSVVLRVRREDRALDWERHQETRPSITLAQLAREKNSERQSPALDVTATELWFHAANADFRKERLLTMLRGLAGRVRWQRVEAIDADPSSVEVSRVVPIWVPYPHVVRVRPMRAPPGGTGVYQLAPIWLCSLLQLYLLPVVRLTAELQELNRTAEAHVFEGIRACAPLAAIERLIGTLRTVYGEREGLAGAHAEVRRLMADLDRILKSPTHAYFTSVRRNRPERASTLLTMLRDPEFNAACYAALGHEDIAVSLVGELEAPSVRGCIGRVLIDAYQELLRVTELGGAAQADLDAAQRAFPTTCRPPMRGATALMTMMSDGRDLRVPRVEQTRASADVGGVTVEPRNGWGLTGNIASLLGSTVGDLPGGTNSLAVTVHVLRLQRLATDRRARVNFSNTMLLDPAVEEEVRVLARTLGADQEELVTRLREVQREWVGNARQDGTRGSDLHRPVDPARLNERIRAYRDSGIQNYQSRQVWPLALTALNILGLISVIAQGPPEGHAAGHAYVEFVGGILGGALNAANGIVASSVEIANWSRAGAALSPLSTRALEYSATLGNAAVWVSMATGVFRVVFYAAEGDEAHALRAAWETAATAAMMSPWPLLQLTGAAVSAGLVLYDIAHAIGTPGAKEVATALLDRFKRSDRGLAAHVAASLERCEHALDNASFPSVYRGDEHGPGVARMLRDLGYSQNLADAVFEREWPVSVANFPIPVLGY